MRVFAGAVLLAGLCVNTVSASALAENSAMAAQKQPMPVVSDAAGATAQAGREVLVQGIARNAKLGAAVINDDLQVYCLALGRWPAEASDQPVAVHGRLELSDEFVAPDDGTRAGTAGPVWVLRDCQPESR
jgi:hypothetical protein